MKVLLFAVAAACFCLPVAVSAENREIVVSPAPTREWVATTSRRLDRVLARVDVSRADTGISTVWFNASPAGEPTNIRTVERGPNGLDRVARNAVRRLRLPHLEGVSEKQVYEAVIFYAETPAQFEKLRAVAAQQVADQRARLAAKGLSGTVLSIGAVAVF